MAFQRRETRRTVIKSIPTKVKKSFSIVVSFKSNSVKMFDPLRSGFFGYFAVGEEICDYRYTARKLNKFFKELAVFVGIFFRGICTWEQ